MIVQLLLKRQTRDLFFCKYIYTINHEAVHTGLYAKKGAPSIKELLPKDSEEVPKGTT